MATKCTDKNALNRSGSSQWGRVLAALLPAYARVDERDEADLILFAKKYAAYLNYYQENNSVDGDWQVFMKMDVSVTLATIAKMRAADFDDFVKIIYRDINEAANENERRKYFKVLFDFVFSLSLVLDEHFKSLPVDAAFKEYMSATVQASLQEPFNRLWQYCNDFITAGYIDTASTFAYNDAPIEMVLSQNFAPAQLSSIWVAVVDPVSLSVPNPADISNSIYHIITHNIFTAQVDIYLEAVANLVTTSLSFLKDTLSDFPSHTPHYALYLTFLKLFQKAQEHVNGFTGRHLDFYYKEVLQLKNKAPVPDSVHLLFELQKGIEQKQLAAGTLFKGGKDVDGKEINYALADEIVVNRAVVKSLQGMQLVQQSIAGKNFETVFASPTANSEDGQGAKLQSVDNSWFAFGDVDKMKEASLGFVIASNYLYLKEGARTIVVNFFFDNVNGFDFVDLKNAFTIQLTGKKAWYDVPSYTAAVNKATKTIAFTIALAADAPAIVPYDVKVHKENYTSALPLVRFYMKNVKAVFNPYLLFKSLALQKIGLTVSADGVKDVSLQNDEGTLDASKPFTPFGASPRVGSAFIMGSKEIFQKKLSRLHFVFDWDNVPDNLANEIDEALHEFEVSQSYLNMKRKFHSVKIAVLDKGGWAVTDLKRGIFTEDSLFTEIFNWTRPLEKYARKLTASDIEHSVIGATTANIQPVEQSFDKNEQLAATSVNGYVKLELNSPDFGHSAYPEALRKAAMNVTVTAVTDDDTTTITVQAPNSVPVAPYTPLAKSFSINYTASTEINLQPVSATGFAARQGMFYQLAPFGYSEVHANLSAGAKVTLLPAYSNAGELLVGLENAVPSATLKVLFQVAEGTSDPLKLMQQVNWYYMVNNNWVQFKKESVSDATNNFTQSGIVTFILPSDIAAGNTLLDATLYWIKAAVAQNTTAVCKLIDIKAQAARAVLKEDLPGNIYFKQLLPAGTISKFLVAEAAVKKVTQPFESFGGRTKEADEKFYTRVSERLRHKQRAIAVWDYEKIILEQFPSIYKAKAVNHTGLVPGKKAGELDYMETLPGHVTVVTIPDLKNNLTGNKLKPYTSIGLLTNIDMYLKKLISPFVELHVINPKFEELQFEFKVKILPPFDVVFYTRQLSIDIENYLCPWAWDSGTDIEFGGKIYKSVVLDFIEELPYVDYVLDFKMHHIAERGVEEYRDVEEAKATTGISLMVSYYNQETDVRHLVEAIEE
ncbi:baseplate J/gp47 family protein [Foetidibacter luteolus]|uniref:baseplate J/gp47 family protein n=1 Tax=Foetidibacter luteolus TaxID=2608880 RepID=UPI00129B759D|nr:baseplate J/gp47 family protein [Foetidibacter luteolus]